MKILIVVSCLIGISLAEIVERPFFMQPCKRIDPNRNECVRESIENFLHGLEKNPTYYNDLRFEPLEYGPITFRYDYENLFKTTFTFLECKCYGLQNARVLKTKTYFSDKEMRLHALVKHPKLWVNGEYEGSGELGTFKSADRGTFNVTMLDVTTKWTVKGSVVNRNGVDFLNIDFFDINPDAKGMKLTATGERTNQLLIKTLIDVANQNWRTFFEIMIPESRKQWQPEFKKLSNRIIRNIPYNTLSLI
ncbi:uncharacterized protein [Chironomus tepperi]|uniref:uncharacterized protein n=1 Tax=Chironomus tepperi TaxID=113505 RepID=UPI00391FAD45